MWFSLPFKAENLHYFSAAKRYKNYKNFGILEQKGFGFFEDSYRLSIVLKDETVSCLYRLNFKKKF